MKSSRSKISECPCSDQPQLSLRSNEPARRAISCPLLACGSRTALAFSIRVGRPVRDGMFFIPNAPFGARARPLPARR
jgi:hypothetical protein